MALVKSVNKQPATAPLAIYGWAALLVTAGWTKVADSDGTTYSSSGAQVTGGATGAHGLNNASAWMRMRMPDGSRELTIQLSAASTILWRVKWSASGFSGGSPGATQTPSATDEAIVLGGGTDASPTYAQLFGAADGSSYWVQSVADTAAPYGFGLVAYANSADPPGYVHSKFILDPVAGADASDPDPYVLHAAGGSSGADTLNATVLTDPTNAAGSTAFGWLGKGAGGTFVALPACELASDNGGQVVAPAAVPINPSSARWDLLPPAYLRRAGATGTVGRKGTSTWLRWVPSATPVTGDLYTVVTTGDWLVLSAVAMRWGGDTPSGTGTTPATRSANDAAGASSTVVPVVANLSPAAGSAITPGTPLAFDVTDASGSLRRVFVTAKFPHLNAWEVVHDGVGFGPAYAAASTRTAIPNGYHYVVTRTAGWTDAPTLQVDALDPSGNEN